MSAIPSGIPTAAEVLDRARGENFPVASVLFPAGLRPHLLRVYGFARLADQLGDDAPGDRREMLEWLSAELDAIYGGGEPSHRLTRDLAATIRARGLPREPFDRLVEANRLDQTTGRYETFADLRGYCALSAEPVGELVLRIAGAATPTRRALSDDVCTGLQLVEFWQDLGEDAARGRCYVPLEDLRRFGYGEEDLRAGVVDRRFAALMAFEAARTRDLLLRGRPLARSVPGRVGLAIRLFVAGGLAALGDLGARGFDTFARSAHASRPRRLAAAAREVLR